MSGTTFTNGSIVTPTFLNTIYQSQITSGYWGIKHDGTGTGPFADGHASQINLATDTTGLLDYSKIDSVGAINLETDTTRQLAIANVDFTDQAFYLTLYGFASPINSLVTYTMMGKWVMLYIPTMTATSNSTSMYLYSAGMPSEIAPLDQTWFECICWDGGDGAGSSAIQQCAACYTASTGHWDFYKGSSGVYTTTSAFSTGSLKGVLGTTWLYRTA